VVSKVLLKLVVKFLNKFFLNYKNVEKIKVSKKQQGQKNGKNV